MRSFLVGFVVSGLIVGCGGGGADPAQVSSVATTAPAATLCGVEVGAKLLEGFVTDVHDGDTITLNSAGVSYRVRLNTIDAPELAQVYGSFSQINLAASVLGKPVKVGYTKMDQYGRIVGSVFTESCQYINLNQVATGMAWFYKAYQCEMSAAVRSQFLQAQNNAIAAKVGLWAQLDPEAPWFYRNGVEPVTPVCTSDSPSWLGDLALTSIGSTTPGNASVTVPAPPSSPDTSVICHTGPRGGTYTISANGNKNYSGC